MWHEEVGEIDNSLSTYQIYSTEPTTHQPKLISHIAEMETSSMRQQFLLLGSISNFQHLQFPSLSAAKVQPSISNQSSRYMDHILYDPTSRTSTDGLPLRKYIPSSPRNKTIYLSMLEESEGSLYKIVKHLIYLDSLNEITCTIPNELNNSLPETDLNDEPLLQRKGSIHPKL